jgi:ribosomal protein L37AE/L43A
MNTSRVEWKNMITLIIIIVICWFIFGDSSSGSTGSASNSQTASTTTTYSNSNSGFKNSKMNNYQVMNNKNNFTNRTCPKCKNNTRVNISSQSNLCNKCGWNLSKGHVEKVFRLSGVTYEGRQNIIANMSVYDQVSLKRDPKNHYDRNAIGVETSYGQNIGWIPKENAKNIAPSMDTGTQYFIKILRILGGNGYNFGVEVLVTNDREKLNSYQAEPNNTINKRKNVMSYYRQNHKDKSYNSSYKSDSYDDYENYSVDDYFPDESYRGSDDYDPSEDWTDLYEYNENH